MHECGPDCTHVQLSDLGDFTSILEELAKAIHEGNYPDELIPDQLYFNTASKLAEAITSGLTTGFAYDDPLNSLAARLKANLYQFSGAKSLTEVALLTDMLLDDDGQLKSFSQYRQDVQKMNKLYNERYLSAEYQNAIAQAQAAEQWQQWGPDDYLEYSTVGDERVRKSHEVLDKIVLHVSSPVWNRIYPPNDWGCRCTVVPAEKPENPLSDKQAGQLGKIAVGNPIFENNPGKSGIVYNGDHPYFKAVGTELDSVKNYGMQTVDKIMKRSNLPTPTIIDSDQFDDWWSDMMVKHGKGTAGFTLTDNQGTHILFDQYTGSGKKPTFFKEHLLRKGEGREQHAPVLSEMVANPDEKWYNKAKGKDSWIYVKYYNDHPYVLVVEEKENVMTAKTFYRADDKERMSDFASKRKGVLLHKK